MTKNIEIRNSTAEFLIFMLEGKEDGIQVMYKDETIWVTQKAMAQLFDCSTDNISLYNPQIQISAESETKRSIFRKRDKTKRSKKGKRATLKKPKQKVCNNLCFGFIIS